MRAIGLFTAWACKDWVNAAIENHLRIVDELHVMIAPHNQRFQEIGDDTLEIAKAKWGKHPQVIFYEPNQDDIRDCCDRTKCIFLNQMRVGAKTEKDDILMICDSDEFYDDVAVDKIRDKFDGFKWDVLDFDARYFAVNMKWYMYQPGLRRLFRVRNKEHLPEFHFKPTQRPIPRPQEIQILLKDCPMFHYSLLSPIKYKLIHWGTERGVKPEKLEWLTEIYAKWDPENPALCEELSKKNPTSCNMFYVNNDMDSPPHSPYLHKYNGKHPVEIEKAGLTKVRDFR